MTVEHDTSQDTWLDRIGYRIFTPRSLLVLLTAVNAITYFDVGVMSAVLPKVAVFFKINHTQQGTIASAYNVGFMICCPIAAALASHIRPKVSFLLGLTNSS
jgi:predicted MFS family arabinose efflux permease